MELAELLEVQKDLNSHLSASPSRSDWEMALLCEVGELCDSLRDGMPGHQGWVWWKRADRSPVPSSRETVLEELADILHFILAGRILSFVHLPDTDLSISWEKGWATASEHSLSALLRTLCGSYTGDNLFWGLPQAVQTLGFTREELEIAYLAKVDKNRARWAAAENETGTTIREAQARQEELKEGVSWAAMYLPGLPKFVRQTLRPLKDSWDSELGDLRQRLEKVLDMPLPQ